MPEDGSTSDFSDCTIWEAALATSAAPFYFEAAKINGKEFCDGGLANNNPINKVLDEAGSLTPACIVSLGTGRPESLRKILSELKSEPSSFNLVGRMKNHPIGFNVNRLLKNLTDSEDTHTTFEGNNRKTGGPPYFRMNPETEEEIGLEEYLKLKKLEGYAEAYIRGKEGQDKIQEVAEILVQESSGPVCPY